MTYWCFVFVGRCSFGRNDDGNAFCDGDVSRNNSCDGNVFRNNSCDGDASSDSATSGCRQDVVRENGRLFHGFFLIGLFFFTFIIVLWHFSYFYILYRRNKKIKMGFLVIYFCFFLLLWSFEGNCGILWEVIHPRNLGR